MGIERTVNEADFVIHFDPRNYGFCRSKSPPLITYIYMHIIENLIGTGIFFSNFP